MKKYDSQEIVEIASQLFANPELGYREFKTKETIETFLKKYHPEIEIEYFSTTGMKVRLSKRHDVNICLLAELDAVYAPKHWLSNQDTGAAHNCGHHSQIAIALSMYRHFMTTNDLDSLNFDVTFVFVPAEEYVDLDYRKKLREEGIITYFGGKPEAMKLGVFDDIDATICVHAMGGYFEKRSIELNCDLAGFMYKHYHFKGVATHAGFDPFSAINAYNISNLFNNAIGFLRQQFKDLEYVRMNPVIVNGDMSLNIIPDATTIGTDVRTRTVEYLVEVSKRLDQAAKGSSDALGGEVIIETELGYLPFIQNRYLNSFADEALKKHPEIQDVLRDNMISAAGDVGDLSIMMPVIQIGYSGFKGTIHGVDFDQADLEMIYSIFPSFLVDYVHELSTHLDPSKLYKKTYQDYLLTLNQFK